MKTNKKNILIAAGILIFGILLGWALFGGGAESEPEHDHTIAEEGQIWTCSMHPQIRQSEPGQCPICGMDLIPVSAEQGGLESDMLQMSEDAMKLANISTMTVGKGTAAGVIRLNGKVEVDERNSYTQATHIPGRIEQLRVNFTGEKVNRGQTLAMVYSPALVTAQSELLQAQEIRESQPELFEAAKQKLRNWKIGESQIDNMLERGAPVERFPITADVSGVVTELMAEQGDYLERGMPVYQIANLSKVWILFDLYESDLNWIEEGNKVEYTVRSIPGKTFEGKISFIDPLLNDNTRVATARIEVNNSDGKLKPGMFVSGVIENEMARGDANQIVIPESAVLWTGERSVVYIKKEMNSGAGFELREVTLGPSLGGSYIVEKGLEAGEEIVVNGTFTVDAAVQLAGKPSMMNPQIGEKTKTLNSEERTALMPVFMNYLELKDALVADDFEEAKKVSEKFHNSVVRLEISTFSAGLEATLELRLPQLEAGAAKIVKTPDIESMRAVFDELSASMINLAITVNPMDELYIQHCPMANSNKGANWLSRSSEIRNPYYGEAMLTCGEVRKTL